MRKTVELLTVIGLSTFLGICLLGTANAYRVWQENPAPVEMSLAEYLQQRPKAEWLRLTNCQVDYPAGVLYRGKLDRQKVSDLSIPVYPDGDRTRPVQMVLYMPGPTAGEIEKMPRTTQFETIEGVIRSGPLFTGLSSDLQNVAHWQAADSCITLQSGEEPGGQKVAAMGGFSLVIALLVANAIRCYRNALKRELLPAAPPEPWETSLDGLYAQHTTSTR